MKIRRVLLTAAFASVLTVPVLASTRRLGEQHAAWMASQARLDRVESDARRIIDLRVRRERIADRKRPPQDVIDRVNDALSSAGIPLQQLAGVRTQPDSVLPGVSQDGPAYRRQSMQITLRLLTVPQVGAFLAEWRRAHHFWTPIRIDLTHVRKVADPLRYDLNLTITATYLADS